MAVAAWRMKMRTASFRGVEFCVSTASDQFGRQTVLHEFPQADMPYNEDLGEATRHISVSGFVSGSGYMARRDALEAAFTQKGPGILVHPWYGRVRVSLESPVTGTHSAQDGGMWSFTAQFVRVEEEGSSAGGLIGKASLSSLLGERAARVMELAGYVANGIALGQSIAWTVMQAAQAVAGFVSSVTSILGVAEDVTPFSKAALEQTAAGSTAWLTDLAAKQGLGGAMRDLLAASEAAMPAMADSFADDYSAGGVSVPSLMLAVGKAAPEAGREAPAWYGTSRRQALAAENAVAVAWQALALAHACQALEGFEPRTVQAANEVRQGIVDAADRLLQSCDDDLGAAVMDLCAVAVRQLAKAAGAVPDVLTVQAAGEMPSLAHAWRWTGGIEAESDLIRRNAIAHPGFVPGGRALEVLHAGA